MNRRTMCRALAVTPMVCAMKAAGQSPRVLRVAWVSPERAGSNSPNLFAFREGLRQLGYTEGKNLSIDAWWGGGSSERLDRMAADIVRAKPEVIVTGSGLAVLPMVRAGVQLPIVFVVSADPVEAKLVASFARPGGNLTGMSLFSLNLIGKRFELLTEVMPNLKRIAIIANPDHSGEHLELKAAQTAAMKLGISYRYFPVRSESEFDAALAEIARGQDEAVLAFADGFTLGFAHRLAEFSVMRKVPTISGWASFAQRGNLMSYGPVIEECYRRLAVYVDRIHRGAKPADLPIELPTKVELVINLKTAKALGLTVPPSLLQRADTLIE